MAEEMRNEVPNDLVRNLTVHAWSRYPMDGINFLIVGTRVDNQKKVEARLTFYEVEIGKYDEPTFRLSEITNAHQILIDDLWNIGLRPSDEVGSKGQLKATENHLKDMQELVRKLLPKALRRDEEND